MIHNALITEKIMRITVPVLFLIFTLASDGIAQSIYFTSIGISGSGLDIKGDHRSAFNMTFVLEEPQNQNTNLQLVSNYTTAEDTRLGVRDSDYFFGFGIGVVHAPFTPFKSRVTPFAIAQTTIGYRWERKNDVDREGVSHMLGAGAGINLNWLGFIIRMEGLYQVYDLIGNKHTLSHGPVLSIGLGAD